MELEKRNIFGGIEKGGDTVLKKSKAIHSTALKQRKSSKRARYSVDDEDCSHPKIPRQHSSKHSTRVRTLKDMVNTYNAKSSGDTPNTKSSCFPTVTSQGRENETSKVCKDQILCHKPLVAASKASFKEADSAGPSARWGHTLTMISESDAVLVGGQGDKQQLARSAIWHLDMVRAQWTAPNTSVIGTGPKPEVRMGHTVIHNPTLRCIYLYGGSKNKKWFHDVHILDLDDWKWQLVKANGKAPTRAYHSATLYRHEIVIFGGVYPRPDPQPDGCSNEVHIFSPVEQGWYTPIIMGDSPSPRSGHSATLLQDQLVVFGGWDAPVCFNDLYVLDLILMEWSKPEVKGVPPSPRSWHASSALSGNRLLIHGGYNGNDALGDSFIFNLDTLTWTSVEFDPAIPARVGHTALCPPYKYENGDCDDIVMFGGGDNDGAFFKDLVAVKVPFEYKVKSAEGYQVAESGNTLQL